MADSKLVDLADGAALDGSELLYAVQGTNDVKITALQVSDYARANIGIVPEAASVVRQVRNETGTTLLKGEVVYINGAAGNKATVTRAIATSDATSAQTFGLVQADITNNQNGYVVVIGDLSGLDTSAYTEGAQLYLSPSVAGGYTATKQLAPNHLVYIGIVTRSHVNQGQIEVRIQNGYELNEIHDVAIDTPTNGQVLKYNSTTELWENADESGGSYGSAIVNFGAFSYATKTSVADTAITSTSKVMVSLAAPTAPRDADELEFSPINVAAVVNAGVGFDIYATAPIGADGQFNVNYLIGEY